MITQSLLDILASVVASLVGLIPSLALPDWWATGMGYWYSTIQVATQLQFWIPFPALSDVVTLLFFAIGLAVSIKLIRIVASFFTLGGGSAA